MFGSHFGHFLDKPLSSFARKVPLSPNAITCTGFLIMVIAAMTLTHNLFWGGILIILGGLCDMLDGMVARANNTSTPFGAFLDSVLDRYADAFLFLGCAWHFFQINSVTGVALSLVTLTGALLISYVRARAEGLGKDCNIGIMERPERIVLMAFGALTGWMLYVMWAMLVLTHVTVIQRIHHVWKIMKQ